MLKTNNTIKKYNTEILKNSAIKERHLQAKEFINSPGSVNVLQTQTKQRNTNAYTQRLVHEGISEALRGPVFS